MGKYQEMLDSLNDSTREYNKYNIEANKFRREMTTLKYQIVEYKKANISEIVKGNTYEVTTATSVYSHSNQAGVYIFVGKNTDKPFKIKILSTSKQFVSGEVDEGCTLYRGISWSSEIKKDKKFRIKKQTFRDFLYENSDHVKLATEREITLKEILE